MFERVSGTDSNRPILKKAIEESKNLNCTLLIASLDRLSRNSEFILRLRKEGVKF